MNLAALLDDQVRERPQALAIVDASRSLTFAGLEAESRGVAASLAADGLRKGDVVLVLCPMGIPLYVTLVALFRLGVVAMFVDPGYGRAHLDRCCALVRPRAAIGTRRAQWLRLVSSGVRAIPLHRVVTSFSRCASVAVPIAAIEGSEPALLTFTTGSTGPPKLAVRSHALLGAQLGALAASLAMTPGAVEVTALPMFVLANLASGVTSVIPDADLRRPGQVDPAPILRQIRRWQPSRAIGSPALFDRLATDCAARGESLATLTHVFTGGGPVLPSLMDRLARMAPRARISGVYGSTEAEPIAVVEREDIGAAERRAVRTGQGLLAGRVVDGLRLAIAREDARGEPVGRGDVFVPAGQPGEIVVSGDHVLGGGTIWHRTGDAGCLDSQGRLWLLGRCAGAMDDARGTLYPFSIEAAAGECDGVERCALVDVGGRRILAVQMRDGTSAALRALETALDWAPIDGLAVVDRIPVDRRHNAKVDYAAVRALDLSGSRTLAAGRSSPHRLSPT